MKAERKCIVYTRTNNGPLWVPDQGRDSTTLGDAGTSYAILLHLAKRFKVVYVGRIRGTLPRDPNIVHVDPDTRFNGVDEDTTAAEHTDMIEETMARVAVHKPTCVIDYCGATGGFCWIGNPRQISINQCFARYTAPCIALAHYLKVPRFCICFDVRCYPKNQEMTECWSELVPKSLLSVPTKKWRKKVSGKWFRVKEVQSEIETWITDGRISPLSKTSQRLFNVERKIPFFMLAHAHVETGFKKVGRLDAFKAIFGDPGETTGNDIRGWLTNRGGLVHGEGWDETGSMYWPSLMPGPCSMKAALDLLAQSICGPLVSPAAYEYPTSKISLYSWLGCAPLLYGRGEPFTFDPKGKYVPIDSPYRIMHPGDTMRIVDLFTRRPDLAKEFADAVWQRCRPNWSVLDTMLDDWHGGADPDSEEWFQQYGGYREEEKGMPRNEIIFPDDQEAEHG